MDLHMKKWFCIWNSDVKDEIVMLKMLMLLMNDVNAVNAWC